jgi:hypothetical protein
MPIVERCNDIFCKSNKDRTCMEGSIDIEYGVGTAFCSGQDDEGWEKRVEKVGNVYKQRK